MKTSCLPNYNPPRRQRGFLEVDLVVAMALLALAILPVGYSVFHERRLLRAEYYRTVAMELVDGEAEILAAGAARSFPDGTQNYAVTSPAAASLPPGKFTLNKTGAHVRLAWTPAERQGVGAVIREFDLK
jgi:hypothetical protein